MSEEKFNLFQELKRRKVYRAATVYAIIGWLVIQVADVTFPYLGLPDWLVTTLIIITLTGFPIAVIMAWFFEVGPKGLIRIKSETVSDDSPSDRKKKPLTGTITIVVLLALLVGQFVYFSFFRKSAIEVQAATSTSMLRPSNSIAVLPFVNLSEEKDNQYFSDGVQEAVLNNLSMIRDLKVISRTSVERYRDEKPSIPEIASELEVANILEGSVQRIGDQVRITAQLISAKGDEHIWANSYDRQLTDIFAIQSEIAETIAKNLEVALTTEELELIKNAPTSNLVAYDLYLKAQQLSYNSEEELTERIGLLDNATKLDPDFALAYAYKGHGLSRLAYFGHPKSLTIDSAMLLLDLAIEKDPKIWQPYMVRAELYFWEQNSDLGIKNVRKSLDLNPNNPWVSDWMGNYLLMNDEYEEAIDLLLRGATLTGGATDHDDFNQYLGFFLNRLDNVQSYKYFLKAVESNPKNALAYEQLIGGAMFLGDYDLMVMYAEKFRELRPKQVNSRNGLAQAYMFAGNYDQSEVLYEEVLEEVSSFESEYVVYPYRHRLGYAKLKNGKDLEGRILLESHRDTLLAAVERQEANAFAFGDYYDLALIQASLGNIEDAMQWLGKARDHESDGAFFRLTFLMADPMLDNLRDQPEFIEMLQEKKDEQELITSLFHQKLKEYHSRKELKWLKAG